MRFRQGGAATMRSWFSSEDWWAVWLGLLIVALALPVAAGFDALGWVAKAGVWLEPAKAVAPVSKAYGGLPGWVSLGLTFLVVFALVGIGGRAMGFPVRHFLAGFAVIFWISYACWVLGHYAYIAQTPDKREAMGIAWSLGLTGEAGFIVALLAGLGIGNFAPRFASWLKDASRPEWYIKTGIVILGASLGVKAVAASGSGLMSAIMFRGFAAIIEAYLIYWALVYFISRKFFGFSREWAAPLASGISICGVSAAIATGAAIRARPVVPIMVSSLVVIFSVVELIVLPFAARAFLSDEPMVAAAWMGLAVKTDGAAVASGAVTEALVRAAAAAKGVAWQPGWMLMTTTTVKVFIDIFIGIWAFILALIWAYALHSRPGERVRAVEIWERFPKFVIGYFLLFVGVLACGLAWPGAGAGLEAATGQADVFRGIFFVMTFFAIGLASDFHRLWAEGIGKLVLVYAVSLFGFIVWIGLAISWLFFHGVRPPLVQ